MTKRASGEGSVQPRGTDTFRLRYRLDDQRFEKTFHGTNAEARKELRRLLKSADDGDTSLRPRSRLDNGSNNGWRPVRRAADERRSRNARLNVTGSYCGRTSSRYLRLGHSSNSRHPKSISSMQSSLMHGRSHHERHITSISFSARSWRQRPARD